MAEERLTVVVSSGNLDKLIPLGLMVAGAVEAGREVRLLLTCGGVQAFRKGAAQELPRSPELEPLVHSMKERGMPGFLEILRTTCMLGKTRISACDLTMNLLGLRLEDLEDVVTGVTGMGPFLEEAGWGHPPLFL